MAKTEKLLSKIGIIVFLILLALGFVVPSILNNSDSDSTTVEPRMLSFVR